ncbi:UDP-2,4-diacetamido-2,4,6-trideoxy-beta-L-altropyranose hydrolase [Burkholderia sp. THE68]|uniref:UDP-2,4-diacetamido-2,4, 6-trideoxy-beta-L-altropyranose hydrolase n=1 Tax=Burkholderia sp. THE68 TaxID=758782 RepID=UPI001E5C1172|nr:UDP-2,4-diacetamido-2,4,6-trideoxy-beta-L-altropyranose hydrolase [Burkholderia sp. THE68]
MRCLALAHELAQRGAAIHFVTTAYNGHLGAMIRAAGFACHELIAVDERLSMDHRSWTGEVLSEQVAEVKRTLASIGAVDWLVVDHYGLDARFETSCRALVKHVAVIDDLANREHDATLLVDQNLFQDAEPRYRGLIPAHCETLLGPAYALLREEFRAYREACLSRAAHTGALRVLAFFGGGDSSNETEKFLLGCRESIEDGLSVDIAVGGSNMHIGRLRSLAETMPGVRIHRQTPEMAKLMAASDYAFGASGSANWERLCLGLNASVVCVADNQVKTVHALVQQGLVDYIGHSDETTPSTYAQALHGLKAHPNDYLRPAERLMSHVDGLGARRVAHAILDTPR